ncbi:MAG: ribosome maturation factor RimP [Myxococcota bacterium]|nr:ribosome maturation factor RimP [Myxococcales bacterium]
MYRDIPAELKALIEPVVVDHRCELVDVDVQRGHPGLLRIVVDSESGDGRVPIGALAELSREIGTVLDAADWMSGSYRLELTSPGLDRVLGREKDFEAAAAARSVVKLQTRRPLDGRRRYRGVLIGFADATAQVEVDGTVFAVPFDEIEKANTVYEFTSADFKDRAKTE